MKQFGYLRNRDVELFILDVDLYVSFQRVHNSEKGDKLKKLEEKVKRNGELVIGISSFTGPISNVYELPVTEICIGDIKIQDISLCVALHTEKCVIGMDIVGLLDFKYNPTTHVFTYTQMREWLRNPKIRYAIARQIDDVIIDDYISDIEIQNSDRTKILSNDEIYDEIYDDE